MSEQDRQKKMRREEKNFVGEVRDWIYNTYDRMAHEGSLGVKAQAASEKRRREGK